MKRWQQAILFAIVLGVFFQLDSNVRAWEARTMAKAYWGTFNAAGQLLSVFGLNGHVLHSETCCCDESPSPSPSPSPSGSPSASPSGSPSASPSASASASASDSPSESASPAYPGSGWYCISTYSGLSCGALTTQSDIIVEITDEATWDAYQFGACVDQEDGTYAMNTTNGTKHASQAAAQTACPGFTPV